jgi:anti-sigma regulatory factor (Ser/Thr protein kinase)
MRSPHSPEPFETGTTVEADSLGALPWELRLPAVPGQLAIARERVERAALAMGFDQRATHEIVFAVNEAVTNAIRHGRPDEAGTIGLLIDDDGDALTVVVSDSGSFIPKVPDKTLMASHGRGFVLMSSLMDHVELTRRPEGTRLRLRKHRNGSCASDSDDGDV